jgi:hypothetical protein
MTWLTGLLSALGGILFWPVVALGCLIGLIAWLFILSWKAWKNRNRHL